MINYNARPIRDSTPPYGSPGKKEKPENMIAKKIVQTDEQRREDVNCMRERIQGIIDDSAFGDGVKVKTSNVSDMTAQKAIKIADLKIQIDSAQSLVRVVDIAIRQIGYWIDNPQIRQIAREEVLRSVKSTRSAYKYIPPKKSQSRYLTSDELTECTTTFLRHIAAMLGLLPWEE